MRHTRPEEHVSFAAIGTLLCGLLSFPAVFLMFGYGAGVSLLAVLLGCISISRIMRWPTLYTGKWLAILGIALGLASILLLVHMQASLTMYGRP